MIDVALIGAGRIGRLHADLVTRHPNLRLNAVIDRDPERGAELARLHGTTVRDFGAVLDDAAITGIIIASETGAHLDQTIRAVEAGKAVLCEKPVDLDYGRARAAADRLGSRQNRVLVGFNRRFDPHFGALKHQLDEGGIGQLEAVSIISHDPAPPGAAYIRASGGLFKDMTIHDLDTARWLLGEQPVAVYAAASCLVDPVIAAAGDVDTARLVLRTAGGRIATISNSRRSGYGYDQRIEACGSAGALRVDNIRLNALSRWGREGDAGAPLQSFFLDRYAEAFAREIDHFAAILAGTATPSPDFADGIAALALAEAAMRSLASGREEAPC